MRCKASILLLPLLLLVVGGCAVKRTIAITTQPPDADIRIDGVEMGRGQVIREFEWKDKDQTHTVAVSRLGFKTQEIPLQRDYDSDRLDVALKPESRRVSINVTPVPAVISIGGQPVTAGPADSVSQELEFTVDAQDRWTTHTVTADRPGYARAERVITWQDAESTYTLRLEPQRKDLNITTAPEGAQVFLDGEPLGTSPVNVPARPFPVDLSSDQVIPQKLRVVKPGYDPIEMNIAWDDGKQDYHINLAAKTKTVRITTDPTGAVVTINGKPIEASNGVAAATVQFPPINEKGDLATYEVAVTKKTADSEWEPQKFTLAWDSGRSDYSIKLKEILTRPVRLLTAELVRTDDGWQMEPAVTTTLAMKDVTEGARKEPPVQITKLQAGTQIDTLTVAPDGGKILFTALFGTTKENLRSQMIAVGSDGSGGLDYLSDGKSLEITPSFTPAGDNFVFSSNRAGRRMSVWSMSSTGAPGITQLTSGDTNDLWPSIDSDPKPRLFYQAMVDTRPDPRLYMTQLGTTTRTDLAQMSGYQPRVSPKADAVAFVAVNDKTGKRDIYIMPDRGGIPRNLTNTPDVDEFDPAWNAQATRIAFVSDAGVDEERRQNYDIWMMDMSRPERPVQITTNGSWDDHPQWDPSGSALFFRSNRGGEWAIWKITAR